MNNRRFKLLLLSLAVISWASGLPAFALNLTDQWVTQAAAPLVEKQIVDGLSIGYIEGDDYGIVHLGSTGPDGKKADNLTLYEIGSVSKLFTALLLADAVERGEIDLNAAAEVDNAAGIRLPSRDGKSITWMDLSTHRSGLPRLPTNFQATDLVDPYRDYDSKKAATFLNSYKLPRAPGDAQEYSNLGTSVLGYLIAQKAGKSYDELLRERITGPLRMTDSSVSLNSEQEKRLATPHNQFGSATSPWTFADMPGAGGVHATMRDMMRFAKAQLDPQSEKLGGKLDGKLGEAIELAWKPHRDADKSGPAMGLGWVIGDDGQTHWHNGQTGGFTSVIYVNRELKFAVVILCNTSVSGQLEALATRLLLKAMGQEIEPAPSDTVAENPDETPADPASENDPDKPGSDKPTEDKPDADAPEIDAKHRARLVGRYQLSPDFIFTVRDRDGHLMVGITNQPTQEVFADSPTRWSYRGVQATLEFKLPKKGPAKSLILHQNGAEQTARRIN